MMRSAGRRPLSILIAVVICAPRSLWAAPDTSMSYIDAQISAHRDQSGAYVLDSAEEALLSRAWLADHAERSIDVQYFIWSTDNIGILAAEALLRAADRGVKVRVIVDDLLVDAPDDSLLALAQHPNFDIRIYNPKISVGVPLHKRLWNAVTDLRGVNQRMHDKTFVVDGKVAITGGRNMAAEYYDYHPKYNFRDRDVLLAGVVVKSITASFERFWRSDLSVPVETIYEDRRLAEKDTRVVHERLHSYAAQPSNFSTSVREAIETADIAFARLMGTAVWGRVDFVCDVPGKNSPDSGLSGGGRSGRALRQLVFDAKKNLVIQSPYLVPSGKALELFKQTIKRGVGIRINTNSLAATDNLQAFAGYRNQRDDLLEMGIGIFEYRPNAAEQRRARAGELVQSLPAAHGDATFGLHAKTMVIDSGIVFIGTFNLDPRSENLNTEVGAVIYSDEIARRVERAIQVDMQPNNSWNAATDDPDQYASFAKRSKVRFWQALPIKPLL